MRPSKKQVVGIACTAAVVILAALVIQLIRTAGRTSRPNM